MRPRVWVKGIEEYGGPKNVWHMLGIGRDKERNLPADARGVGKPLCGASVDYGEKLDGGTPLTSADIVFVPYAIHQCPSCQQLAGWYDAP